jgi:anthranilate phosphoribosyltransferase
MTIAVPNVRHVSLAGSGELLASLGGWPAILTALAAKRDLSDVEMSASLGEILTGAALPSQIAAFAMGLRSKGETVAELSAALVTMYSYSVDLPLTDDERLAALCTCGTGGDRSNSINISTVAAFVVAGAGMSVCKHGGRAASSQAGSGDVLEALGVALDATPEGVAECIRQVGFGFCLAPRFHPAMRFAGPTRKELGIATLFNFLGPMANPGRVGHQVMGISDPVMGPKVARVLALRGTNAMVVHGHDGFDEITTTTTSTIWRVINGDVSESVFDPLSVGIRRSTSHQLLGGTAPENAEALKRIVEGELGPQRDIVIINAAASLVVGGLAAEMAEGCELAAQSIDDGRAGDALEGLVRVSNQYRDV